MKALTTALAIIMTMGTHVAPASAQTSYSTENFTAQKLCEVSRAPRGFKKVEVFVQTAQYYRPLFDVYQSNDKQALLISNTNGGCWIRIDMKTSALSIKEITPPFAGGAILMNRNSRNSAKSKFWSMRDDCGNTVDGYKTNMPEGGYISSLYYIKRFQRDFPISTYPDGESLCFQALGYGSDSILIELENDSIILDIIVGIIFLGETK